MKKNIFWMLAFFFAAAPAAVFADYAQELRDQIADVQKHAANSPNLVYFHDMGIVARKADDAELNDLATEITGTLLLKKMETYVDSEIERINQLYVTDPVAASHGLVELNHFERYYQPTAGYLNTTGGQSFAAELARIRKDVIAQLKEGCLDDNVRAGLVALKKTGLFITEKPEEILSMRDLPPLLDCCLGWKKKIHYENEKEFETDYEKGTLTEEAHLVLQSNPKDLSEAYWTGEWLYHFKGRQGTGEGVSQARFRYRRGEETADLVITNAKVTAAGRMNMPTPVAGDHRTVDVEGKPLHPAAVFVAGAAAFLTGCHEDKP